MGRTLITYRGFKIGDKVSVIAPDKAYNGAGMVTPDMIGVIKSFPPKVQKVEGHLYDRGDYFVYIIYEKGIRAGIDICNLKKIL